MLAFRERGSILTTHVTAGQADLGHIASYSIPEAAHYLRIPSTTLRSWVLGRAFPTKDGRRFAEPPIAIADHKGHRLSFVNLIEAHVLWAIRRKYDFPLQTVRRALRFLSDKLGSSHPLATRRFETDGVDLFVPQLGDLINITREGQLAMRELLTIHLKRIERSEAGEPSRLYPFTRKDATDEPRSVVIDPRISFGRPVLVGTGIPTALIAERYKAGETMDDLAKDYERDRADIEEAVRCELELHTQAA